MPDGQPGEAKRAAGVSPEKLAETSPVAITKVDSEGRIVYANSKAEAVLGLKRSEITGRTYDDVEWKITHYDGSHYPTEKLPFEIVKRTKEPVNGVRHAIEWPGGERKLFSINASPLFNDRGDFDGIVSVIEDVTVEIMMEQREDHLSSVISSIRDVNQLLVRADAREKLIEGICDILIKTRDYYNVWVALLDEDGRIVEAAEEGLGEKFESMLRRFDRGDLPRQTEQTLNSSGVTVTDNPAVTCEDCPLAGKYEGRGALSARLEYQGEVYGIISASTSVTFAKDEEEQELFNEVAGDIGFGLHDIAVQEQREKALRDLRKKDERLERALEGGDLGTWDWNIETDEVKFNERWAEMKGYKLEELKPHLNTWKGMVHPDDYPGAREKLDKHLKGETETYKAELRMRDKSGDWIWVLDRGKVIERDEEGNPVRACGTHLDITERKRSEKKSRRAKEQLRRAIQYAPFPVMIHAEDGEVMSVNETWLEITGYEKEDLLTISQWTKKAYGEEKNNVQEHIERLYELDERIDEGEYEIRTKSGGTRIWDFSSAPIGRTVDGERLVLSIADDVTARKHAEQKVEEERDKAKRYLDIAGSIIVLIDEDRKIKEINQKGCRILGYDREEIIGRDMYESFVPERFRDAVIKDTRKPIMEGNLENARHYENPVLTREGEERIIAWVNTTVKEDGEVVGTLSSGIDITERKRMEDRIQEDKEELKKSFIQLAETTSRVLGVRDPYTQQHELRVGELARKVGERLGLDEERQLGLYLGGVLHDIGKIAIPETILTKPGELKPVEWDMIRSHPKIGYRQILEDTDFPWPVAEMTLHHHERLDGSGYPDGLAGDELTREVRIIGACDVVEAMSTRRPYREARSKEETLNALTKGKGEKFDPELIEVLVKMIKKGEVQFGKS